MRRALPCFLLLVLCASARAAQDPAPAGRLLAFLAAPPLAQVADPAVAIPAAPFRTEPGDVLVYLARSEVPGAGARGVEAVHDDGRRTGAPPLAASGRWIEVRAPLSSGARIVGFELVARGERGAQIVFAVDDVRVERADGTRIEVFHDELQGGLRRLEAPESAAGAVVLGAQAEFAPGHVAVRGDVADPWAAADLAGLRAAERGPDPLAAAVLPRGLSWTGPCVPLRFATDGRAAFLARGQRVGLDPLEGGRFYELWLSVANLAGEPFETRLGLAAVDGSRTFEPLVVPARAPSEGLAPVPVLLSVDVASPASLAALLLPDDPRLAVLAVTSLWRRDGAADPRFRARWLARAAESVEGLADEDRAALRLYLANRRAGASFGAEAADPDADRPLFDALLTRDLATARTQLAAGLALQADAARGRKSARIELAATFDGGDADLAAVLRPGFLPEDLPVAGGEAQSIARLAASDPAAFERLRARVAAGTWTPYATILDAASSARLGADLLARRVAADQLELARLVGAPSVLARVDAEVARIHLLPPVMESAGIAVALLESAPRRPGNPVARWEAGGTQVLALAPAIRADGPLRFDPVFWRPWTAAASAPAGRAPLLVQADVAPRAARETLALVAELSAAPAAPDLAWVALREVAAARADRALRFEPAALPALERATLRAELEALAAVRAAERAILGAAAVEALSTLDGGAAPGEHAPLARAALFRAAAQAVPAAAAAAAREVEARARAAAQERLARLRAALPPAGPGVPLALLDPLPWPRRALLEFGDAALRVAGAAGDLPAQRAASGGVLVELASSGAGPAALRVRRDELAELRAPARVRLAGWTMRSDDLEVGLDPKTGRIARLVALADGREVELLRDGGEQLVWVAANGASEPLGELESIEYVERGPLRAAVRVVRKSPRARVETLVRVTGGAAGLEVRARVELLDRGGDVYLRLPLARATASALAAVPFGAVPLQPAPETLRPLDGWAAASDGGATLALFADGSLAFRWNERAFELLLAESGAAAARAASFRVLGRTGGWRAAGLDGAAHEAAHEPLRVAFDDPGRTGAPREPLVRIARVERDGRRTLGPAAGLVPLSIEAGPKGCVDLRLIETRGEPCNVELVFAREPFGAERIDALGLPLTMLTTTARTVGLSLGAGRMEVVRVRLSP
ncbi:MAG: hypothetical protein JNK02_06530 [Planctomycetes bacterium]|nr:hypothetical protein [Planctomycetota bacterium]